MNFLYSCFSDYCTVGSLFTYSWVTPGCFDIGIHCKMANRNSSAYIISYVFITFCGEKIKNLHNQLTLWINVGLSFVYKHELPSTAAGPRSSHNSAVPHAPFILAVVLVFLCPVHFSYHNDPWFCHPFVPEYYPIVVCVYVHCALSTHINQ